MGGWGKGNAGSAVRAGLFVLIASSLGGCAAHATSPRPFPNAKIQPRPEAAIHQGPLTDFVPAAGLRWMVVGSPRDLAQKPALMQTLERLFPKQKLTSFEETTGILLRQAPSAVAAGFDYGTLYLVEQPQGLDKVVRAFSDRLDKLPVEKKVHRRIRRLTGTVGGQPQSLLVIDGFGLAIAIGDITLARIAEAFALGQLKSPVALRGASLTTLPALEPRPLRFFGAGPFQGEWESGARGLLGAVTALAVTLEDLQTDSVSMSVALAGDWAHSQEASQRIKGAWEDLAGSNVGRLLELDHPIEAPEVSVAPNQLSLQIRLKTNPIVDGLHAAVAADVGEMLGLPRPDSSPVNSGPAAGPPPSSLRRSPTAPGRPPELVSPDLP